MAPYWLAVEAFIKHGNWLGGENALHVMNQVNMELGNAPTSFNCPSCIAELLKLTYNNYKIGKA